MRRPGFDMPPLEQMDCPHKAVMWPKSAVDAYGEVKIGAGVELRVRWEGRRRQSADPNGNPIIIEADVKVLQEVKVGSLMWKGKLDDYASANKPELMEVVGHDPVDDLHGRVTERWVQLTKFRRTPPKGP
jgi:hypothetical protein